jgi:hypothetical protein
MDTQKKMTTTRSNFRDTYDEVIIVLTFSLNQIKREPQIPPHCKHLPLLAGKPPNGLKNWHRP